MRNSLDPFDPDLPELPGGPLAVAALDPALPLTMLPVRLATRLHRPQPGAAPTELWVRIFPDLVHADGHVPELSATEIAIGQAYWERLWRAASDQPGRDDAHRWAVGQLGAPRAAWVIGATRPLNPGDAPREPVPAGEPLPRPPKLPPLSPRASARATLARMLPDYWHVTVRHTIEFVTRAWSSAVRRDLAMAPNLTDMPVGGGVRDLLANQDLWWMVDFDAAVEAGMAVRMPWEPPAGGPRFATEVIVFGVRADNSAAEAELAALLDAQRFTSGVEIVPPGTPTNNTDTVSAGFTATPADLEGHLDRQTQRLQVRRPRLSPARLGTAAGADAASLALGVVAPNAFDRAEHAGLRAGSRAADMNRVLWAATLDHLLGPALATDGVAPVAAGDRTWLAAWCRDWVRGGGFLPAFRIGAQPYGLFPVAPRPDAGALGTGREDQLRRVLLDLYEDWTASLPLVADFSAPRGGRFGEPPPTPEEEAVRLAAVLGAVPHPTAFRLRPATESFAAVEAAWTDGIAELERLLALSHNDLKREEYELEWKDDINDGDLWAQGHGLERLRAFADGMTVNTFYSQAFRDAAADVRDHIDTVLRAMTAAHGIRADTRRWTGGEAHLPTAADPPLWYVEYGDDGAAPDGTFPALRLVPGTTPAATARTLRDFAADARRATSIPRPTYIPGVAKSLLEKLVERSVTQVLPGQAEELALGLEGLAGMVESDDVADPAGELTRLLRETLGLATHRLDAWLSGLANERLAELRAKAPAGVQVGGYGWVVNLEPDEGGADSQGFVHAPSLDHAATAAVLRSAWLNYASDARDAPFGVDVSSGRVRRAQWLLEGVRNGVDLAELLGAKFERRVQAAGRADLIADARRIVLDATGHAGRPATGIVDGLALATAYAEPAAGDPVHDAVEAWRKTLPGYPADGLAGPLRGTVDDLDATADLLTTQAVHSVLKGNLAEGASTLSVAGAGSAGVPQLRVPAVHRESQLINHRVVAVLAPPSGAAPSLLALAEPALAGWLGSLLPPPATIDVAVSFAGGERWAGTAEALGLGAVELVALAGGELAGSLLGGLFVARARAERGVAADVAATAAGALGDVAVAAGALRTLVGAARPLTGDDLATEPGLPHVVDVAELDARRADLAAALGELGGAQPSPELLLARFADLAALDPAGLVAALSAPDDPALVAALLQAASDRAQALLAPLPEDWAELAPAAQAEHLAGRIAAALGVTIPVLARCKPANAAELAASLAASARRLGSPQAAMAWLLAAGRVHDGAGRCAEALDLAEVVHPAAAVRFQVAQLPHVEGEPWVAVEAPTGPGARLDILSVTDAAAALRGGAFAGLIFDAWSEPIPGRRATTGIAVNFDRPGAQPPQAVLLALPPEEGRWTVDHLESLLLDTLQLAYVRAVGPETLTRDGHALPAVALADGAAVAVEPGASG